MDQEPRGFERAGAMDDCLPSIAVLSCLVHSPGSSLDATALSRRALEAARTALAIKLDPENAGRWAAEGERMEQWRLRQNDEKPRQMKIELRAMKSDPLAEELLREMGMLSDGGVHFTPEYLGSLDIQERRHGKELHSEYLESDLAKLASEIKTLACVHLLVLRAFDRCADGGLSRSPAFMEGIQRLEAAVRALP